MKTQASFAPFIDLGMISPSRIFRGGSIRASRLKSSSTGSSNFAYDSRDGRGRLGVELELAVVGGEGGQALAEAVGDLHRARSAASCASACSLAALRLPASSGRGRLVLGPVVVVSWRSRGRCRSRRRSAGWRRRSRPWPSPRPPSRRRRSPAAAARRPPAPRGRASRTSRPGPVGSWRTRRPPWRRARYATRSPRPRPRPARHQVGAARGGPSARASGRPALAGVRRRGARSPATSAPLGQRVQRGRRAHSVSLRSEQSRRTWSSTSASFCMPLIAASTAGSRGPR